MKSIENYSVKALEVIKDVFDVGVDLNLNSPNRKRVDVPSFSSIGELCELLAIEPAEEELQRCLKRNPGFLAAALGGPDNVDLAVLFKPAIGNQYKADFCILQAHQAVQ